MKQAKYIVKLTDEERATLTAITKTGTHSIRKVKTANVLLQLDQLSRYQNGPKRKYMPTQAGIAASCDVSTYKVYKVSKQFVEEGLEATLSRKKQIKPPVQPIITGENEAKIITLACSEPPEGYARWTLRLLEKKVVELGIMEKVSDTTIGRMLKKRR